MPKEDVELAKLSLEELYYFMHDVNTLRRTNAQLSRKIHDLRERNALLLERNGDTKKREQYILKGVLKLHEIASSTEGLTPRLHVQTLLEGIESILRMNIPRNNFRPPAAYRRSVRHVPKREDETRPPTPSTTPPA
jgi:hypothetical protein